MWGKGIFELSQGQGDHSQGSHGEIQGEGYYDKKINWCFILCFEIMKAQRYKTEIIILLEYQLEISKSVLQRTQIFCVKTTWAYLITEIVISFMVFAS